MPQTSTSSPQPRADEREAEGPESRLRPAVDEEDAGLVPGNMEICHGLRYCLYMQTSDSNHKREGASRSDQPFRIYSAVSIGPAIRHYREEAGLTQSQLAEMAGLNRTYLSDLEQGKETEQVRRILRVLRLLGVRATLQKADW
jgi:DNA-binding XRE family transcriptional regulator